jgi:hypothetical protein
MGCGSAVPNVKIAELPSFGKSRAAPGSDYPSAWQFCYIGLTSNTDARSDARNSRNITSGRGTRSIHTHKFCRNACLLAISELGFGTQVKRALP